MEHEGGSGLRTRSKAAPDWTIEESLTLANEIAAVEADCRGTLSSFQKWKIIVENCNALGVNRNLNQCRRKWDSLLSDYKKIKQSGSKKASFNSDLYKAIERYVMECEGGYDTEPDTDTEKPPLAPFVQCGSKNRRSKVITPVADEVEECSSDLHTNTRFDDGRRRVHIEINREEHEESMAENLRENAQLIEAIVKGQMDADLYDSTSDLTRIKAGQIIICLSNLAVTLDEIRKLHTDTMI